MELCDMNVDDLENMKYSDLRKIAKKCGVRANMKADKLVKAIREELQSQVADQSNAVGNSTSESQLEDEPQASKSCSEKKEEGRKRKENQNRSVTESVSSESDTSTSMIATPMPPRLATPKMTPAPGGGTPVLFPPLLTPHIRARTASPFSRLTTPSSEDPDSEKKPEEKKRRRTYELESSAESSPVVNGIETKPSLMIPSLSSKALESAVASPLPKRVSEIMSSPLARRSLPRVAVKPGDTSTVASTVPSPAVTPDIQEMKDSMREDMDDSQRKESLMAVLDKKVKEKAVMQVDSDGESVVKPATQIPRFEAFLKKRAEESNKKATPGSRAHWNQVHSRHFAKMESIDSYLEKKRKRTETITASVKKMKLLAEETRNAMDNLNKSNTPKEKAQKAVKSRTSLFKSPSHSGVPYVPTVTSTSKMIINFANVQSSSTIKFTGVKISSAKTTTRRSFRTPGPSVPSSTTKENRKSFSAKKNARKSGVTPFKPTPSSKINLNQTGPTSQPQSKFDLKASLAKPLTYKPYTGKLKPLENRPQVKEVKVPTRDNRRKASHTARANKRNENHMKRRGIVS